MAGAIHQGRHEAWLREHRVDNRDGHGSVRQEIVFPEKAHRSPGCRRHYEESCAHRCCVAVAGCSLVLADTSNPRLEAPARECSLGVYDAAVKPVLRVASGDTIRVETMVARGLQRLRAAGVAEAEIPSALKAVETAITERGPGAHPLTGPIWIEGAERGDVLEVKIVGFEFLHPYGVAGFIPGSGTLPDDFPYVRFKLVRFDARAGTAAFASGINLKLAPFFGSIGVAPDPLVGRVSSGPPGSHAGNLDNKELVAGSTLYVPVHVPGALLSMGDGHGMQGDGEVT